MSITFYILIYHGQLRNLFLLKCFKYIIFFPKQTIKLLLEVFRIPLSLFYSLFLLGLFLLTQTRSYLTHIAADLSVLVSSFAALSMWITAQRFIFYLELTAKMSLSLKLTKPCYFRFGKISPSNLRDFVFISSHSV